MATHGHDKDGATVASMHMHTHTGVGRLGVRHRDSYDDEGDALGSGSGSGSGSDDHQHELSSESGGGGSSEEEDDDVDTDFGDSAGLDGLFQLFEGAVRVVLDTRDSHRLGRGSTGEVLPCTILPVVTSYAAKHAAEHAALAGAGSATRDRAAGGSGCGDEDISHVPAVVKLPRGSRKRGKKVLGLGFASNVVRRELCAFQVLRHLQPRTRPAATAVAPQRRGQLSNSSKARCTDDDPSNGGAAGVTIGGTTTRVLCGSRDGIPQCYGLHPIERPLERPQRRGNKSSMRRSSSSSTCLAGTSTSTMATSNSAGSLARLSLRAHLQAGGGNGKRVRKKPAKADSAFKPASKAAAKTPAPRVFTCTQHASNPAAHALTQPHDALEANGSGSVRTTQGLVLERINGQRLNQLTSATSLVDAGQQRHKAGTARGSSASSSKNKSVVASVAGLGCRLVRVLEAVHLAGVVHGDLTPCNVLYDSVEDRLVLLDFGHACLDYRCTAPLR